VLGAGTEINDQPVVAWGGTGTHGAQTGLC
jgi:hypothetical protein